MHTAAVQHLLHCVPRCLLSSTKKPREKFFCRQQGTPKRDEQRCGEVINSRPTKLRPLQCKHAQKGAFGAGGRGVCGLAVRT